MRRARLALSLAFALGLSACEPERAPAPRAAPSTASPAFSYDPEWKAAAASPPSRVTFETTAGPIRCKLDASGSAPEKHRFGALARGEARYRSRDGWVKRPAYDGAAFDRVAAGRFVIARPLGAIAVARPDATAGGHEHDRAGLLSIGHGGAVALTATAAPELDAAGMAVIGSCDPIEGIDALSRVPARFGRPLAPTPIERVVIDR